MPGMRFSEHLPRLAKLSNHLALVRSMQTKEGDHSRGTFLVRTAIDRERRSKCHRCPQR